MQYFSGGVVPSLIMVFAARNLSLEAKRYNPLVVSYSTHKTKSYKKKIPEFSQQRTISYYIFFLRIQQSYLH